MISTVLPKFISELKDPLKDEYLLPIIADAMLKEGTEFSVLSTDDHWFGVTYKEDKESVIQDFKELYNQGEYQRELYSDLKRTE